MGWSRADGGRHHDARQYRLRTLGESDKAAVDLRAVAAVMLNALDDPDLDVRAAVLAQVPRDRLETAVVTVEPGRSMCSNEDGTVNRRAYTLAVVEALRDALRRHDVFVTPSRRWSDPPANS